MSYPLFIILGVLPSFIWLLFYLRKDVHPESKRMVLRIFFYGLLVALPVAFIEIGIINFLKELSLSSFLLALLSTFLGVALIEEFFKYLVVKEKVLNHPEFDEPIDVVLYMIIAALGFAAAENILILFAHNPPFCFGQIIIYNPLMGGLIITVLRFLGATFLHTLCSGIVGYFLAIGIFETKKRNFFLVLGLITATLLHGLYNFAIEEIKEPFSFAIPFIILISLAIFLFFAFKRLKKMKSTCRI